MAKQKHFSQESANDIDDLIKDQLKQLGFSHFLFQLMDVKKKQKYVLSNSEALLDLNFFNREFCTDETLVSSVLSVSDFETQDSYLSKISDKARQYCAASFQAERDQLGLSSQFSFTDVFKENGQPQSSELFEFYTEDGRSIQFEDLVANRADCERFKLFFRDKAKEFIQTARSKQGIRVEFADQQGVEMDSDFDLQRIYLCAHKPDVYVTRQEARCLAWMFRLRTVQEIAIVLNLSPRTVESYIENIKNRLGCNTRAELYDLLSQFKFNPDLFI